MRPSDLVACLARAVRDGTGIAHKRDIEAVVRRLGLSGGSAVMVGDDCAAIHDGDGYLLLGIEGFLDSFVAEMPWFAGYCGVMVNLSDIAAMGGRPIAIVDALWSHDGDCAGPILDGLSAASAAYGVPIVGGHSNLRSNQNQLSVAVLGRAHSLLTSFDARPGDTLIAAIDLRGSFHDPHPFWDASSRVIGTSDAARLRKTLDILPAIAEAGLCQAAKDVSMAGLIGTALMMAECSAIGMTIDLDAIPRPPGADLARWLSVFPSFGFLLAVKPRDVPPILARFDASGIAASAIGSCDSSTRLDIVQQGARATCWDLASNPLLGCGKGAR